MIEIVVLLTIKDHSLFGEYEAKALGILRSYGGNLVSAFAPALAESTDSGVDEIHYLQFPDIAKFHEYRADARLAGLAELRERAIAVSQIYVSGVRKEYDAN